MTSLHGQQRRASAPYLDGRIRVGMVAVSAVDTGEDRLALSASCVDDTAGRTGLRSVGGGNGNQPPAGGLKLVVQHGGKERPALREDRTIEASLLGDAFPLGLGGHGADIQTLNRYNAEASSNRSAGDVECVGPGAGDAPVNLGHSGALLGVATRSPLTPRKNSLRLAAAALKVAEVRQPNVLPGREADGVGDAPVEAHRGQIIDRRGLAHVAGENDVPDAALQFGRDSLRCSGKRSRRAKLDEPDLGNVDCAPLAVQMAREALGELEPQCIVATLHARSGELSPAGEERLERPIKVDDSRLLAHTRRSPDEVELRPQRGQLKDLVKGCDASPVGRAILAPEVAALLPREVVNQPVYARPLLQPLGLRGRRMKPKFEAAKHGRSLAHFNPQPQGREADHG